MNNYNDTTIFDVPDQNSQDSYEVIEGNTNDNIITTENITAGQENIISTEIQIEDDTTTKKRIDITSTQRSNAILLWAYINENCYQPFYSAFKGQFVAEALQVSISIVPILIYQGIRKPYTPCQDKPESFFIQMKNKKAHKKTWRQRVFSLETLCILTLATTVFVAGLINDDASHGNEFKHSRNRKTKAKSTSNGFQTKYGAYR